MSSGPENNFDPARLRPIPILDGTPNFPIIIIQTLNLSQSRTCVSATNTFEPGWILLDFIDRCPLDQKRFDPSRLRPIPIFYGTPNFPIIIIQTLNPSQSRTCVSATNTFEPGWILLDFIDKCRRDAKQFDPARLRPIPIFYGTPNFPIIILQTLNSCPIQTCVSATNAFEPG